jgi:hypothetical protein
VYFFHPENSFDTDAKIDNLFGDAKRRSRKIYEEYEENCSFDAAIAVLDAGLYRRFVFFYDCPSEH